MILFFLHSNAVTTASSLIKGHGFVYTINIYVQHASSIYDQNGNVYEVKHRYNSNTNIIKGMVGMVLRFYAGKTRYCRIWYLG